jgi:hypothetical protein
MAAPVSSSSVQASNYKQDWITPGAQLKRLWMPVAKEIASLNILCPDIENMVAQSALDESVTNWYTALSRLRVRPDKIPPLPNHIGQTLDSNCPIYREQRKLDGTRYKVKDTHVLVLVPEEFGTVNQFERDVLKPYGEANYPANENPLQFRYFLNEARREHADKPFAPTHWILITKDPLPGSRDKSWNKQVDLVNALSQEALINYEIPTLQEAFAMITTHKVVTQESLYQAGNAQNGDVFTYTRVKETIASYHLVIGGSAPSGVRVDSPSPSHFGYDYGSVGVAALRKFEGH